MRGLLEEAQKLMKEAISALKMKLAEGDKEARKALADAEKSLDKLNGALSQSAGDSLYTALGSLHSTGSGASADVSVSPNKILLSEYTDVWFSITVNYLEGAMSEIAKTPVPPYYAVIFSSHRTDGDNGYADIAERMVKLASDQPGFLGMESARENLGITVSYWESIEAISNWKKNADHREAQRLGHQKWYSSFRVRVAKIEREYGI